MEEKHKMKSILIHLEDDTYDALLKAKGEMSWKQFLLIGVKHNEH